MGSGTVCREASGQRGRHGKQEACAQPVLRRAAVLLSQLTILPSRGRGVEGHASEFQIARPSMC